MAFVPAPNIIELEFRYLQEAQNTENRIMVDNLGAVAPGDLEDLAILGWNWWQDTYSDQIPTNVELREVVATDLSEQNGGQYTYSPSTGVTGAVTGGAFPNEVSFCLSLRTAARGRSARGRWYVAGVPLAVQTDANHVNSTYAGNIRTALAGLVTAVAGAGKQAVIVSYVANKAPRPGGPVYFALTGVVFTDLTFDSMKSRKPGVGT